MAWIGVGVEQPKGKQRVPNEPVILHKPVAEGFYRTDIMVAGAERDVSFSPEIGQKLFDGSQIDLGDGSRFRLASSCNDVVGDELVLDATDVVSKKAISEMTVPRLHGLLACRLALKWKTDDPAVTARTATRWMQRNMSAKYFHRKNYNRRQQSILRRRN